MRDEAVELHLKQWFLIMPMLLYHDDIRKSMDKI